MKLLLAFTAAAMLTAPAMSAACRDAKGKFIACPTSKAAPAKKCRDAKGHFAKCGTAGAKPV